MNFCTEALGTRITVVDKVAEESYEVTNLIQQPPNTSLSYFNSGGCTNNTGFMSARFIRPPVTIRLNFSGPIDISHIVLSPKLSQQFSTGFTIQTDINFSKEGQEKSNLHQIGREFLSGPPFPDPVVFRNPRFLLHRKYCTLPLLPFESHQNFPNSFELRHPSHNSCERVFSLYVTIERTYRTSVPVLGSLQVWGQPSKWTTISQVKNLLKNCLPSFASGTSTRDGKRKLDDKQDNIVDAESVNKRSRSLSSIVEEGTFSIPDEFLDPITFETICQPIRLPCGIAVDSKTLDKYYKEEAIWGRAENDPFTGKTFTETCRPIVDISLKSRIDAFLTQNSSNACIKILPRTLGTETTSKFQSSRIISSSSTQRTPLVPPSSHTEKSIEMDEGETMLRRPISSKEFMDKELARIIASGPSLKPEKIEMSSHWMTKCFKCFEFMSENQTQSSIFYKTSCNHTIICRKCLVLIDKTKRQACISCEVFWTAKELSRIFG